MAISSYYFSFITTEKKHNNCQLGRPVESGARRGDGKRRQILVSVKIGGIE